MTRKPKDVYKQLVKNPKVQIAAFPNEGRGWMRITCKLVEEETPKIRTTFLDKYPNMKEAHPLDDPDYAFMKLVGITAHPPSGVFIALTGDCFLMPKRKKLTILCYYSIFLPYLYKLKSKINGKN